jgi:mRNA-degrading endonuclease RelE of RelBE toxin-antitoxin system
VRIAVTIDALSEEPRPAGCQPVKSAPKGAYRIRVGNYRAIYTVLDDEQQIIVARVAKRDERTYQGLD